MNALVKDVWTHAPGRANEAVPRRGEAAGENPPPRIPQWA
jgi:hypothetical protein